MSEMNQKGNSDLLIRRWERTVVTDRERKLHLTIQLRNSSLEHVQQKHGSFLAPNCSAATSSCHNENENSYFCFDNLEDIIGAAVATGAVTNDKRRNQEGRLAIWAHFPTVVGYGIQDGTPRHKILVTLKPISKIVSKDRTRVVADIITAFPAICFTCKTVPLNRNTNSCRTFHFSLGKSGPPAASSCVCRKPYCYRLKRTGGNRDLKIDDIHPQQMRTQPELHMEFVDLDNICTGVYLTIPWVQHTFHHRAQSVHC